MNEKLWKTFQTEQSNFTPKQLQQKLDSIPELKISHSSYDPITDELHCDFEFQAFCFSFHNPHSSVYGYWFFIEIRRNDFEAIQK
jgi:hypothetical protein